MFWNKFVVVIIVGVVNQQLSYVVGDPDNNSPTTIGDDINPNFPQCSATDINTKISATCTFNWNYEEMKNTVNNKTDPDARANSLKRTCTELTAMKSCMPSLAQNLAPCATDGLNNILQSFVKNDTNIQEFFDLITGNDCNRIFSLIDDTFGKCIKSQNENLKKCFNDINLSPEISRNTLSLEKLCNKFSTYANCYVETLKSCSDTKPGEIVGELYNFVLNRTCLKGPEQSSAPDIEKKSSSASSLSVMSAMVITIVLTSLF